MCKCVFFEIMLLIEASATHNANIGLAVRVDFDVCMQIGDSIERFATFVTRVRLDGRVC